MLGKFFNRVVHLRVHGIISDNTYDQIARKLDVTNENVHLVAQSINSIGGSTIQSKKINNLLHSFARANSCPVYTFAEDLVFNGANVLLLSGHKVYASNLLFIIEQINFH